MECTLATLIACGSLAILSACAITPAQKKVVGIAAGVLIVGAIAAHDSDNGKSAGIPLTDSSLPCHPQPNGTCR